MSDIWLLILLIGVGYVIGSIPSAYLAMHIFTGKDIRTMGTGSATVTAVMIHGGKIPGAVGLLGEVVKAAVCVLIARTLVGEEWAYATILVAAIYGSSYSVWLKGNGGQGQTIMVTGLIMVNYILTLVIGLCYLLPILITRRHVLSNHIFHIALPISLGFYFGAWQWGLAGFMFVLPATIRQFTVGDEMVHAKKMESMGQNSTGAL